ncbi:hypothetical protein KNT86_gp041 [Enterobacteria phage vB_EcoM_IME341]|uniref:Uncharacterized protein n=1 Tax=Enterobacteria phage vB_EcoM_IME341 TaxID=2163891 RepID=A0A2S1GRF6_9CAUD|nr:hypothetical protein KNT86_gp041 [Enterobacteria phage vB_EcoM_IME341]AWD91968.1 hypothetical protein [Enterobacteria phage vB_EcoM_IME341]
MLAEYTCFAKDDAHPELVLEVKVNHLDHEFEWSLYIHPKNIIDGPQKYTLNDKCISGIIGYGTSESKYSLEDIRNSRCAVSYFDTDIIKHLYKLVLDIRKDFTSIKNAVKELK